MLCREVRDKNGNAIADLGKERDDTVRSSTRGYSPSTVTEVLSPLAHLWRCALQSRVFRAPRRVGLVTKQRIVLTAVAGMFMRSFQ